MVVNKLLFLKLQANFNIYIAFTNAYISPHWFMKLWLKIANQMPNCAICHFVLTYPIQRTHLYHSLVLPKYINAFGHTLFMGHWCCPVFLRRNYPLNIIKKYIIKKIIIWVLHILGHKIKFIYCFHFHGIYIQKTD